MKLLLLAVAIAAIAACGDSAAAPAVSPSARLVASPGVDQKGSADATVDQSSVSISSDAAHNVVITVKLTANATRPAVLQSSLSDTSGQPVGTAKSGALHLTAGETTTVTLNGDPSSGTIAHASFELVPA